MKAQITMKLPTLLFSMLTVLIGLPTLVSAVEAPPERMTYQGFVVDGNGTALGNASPENYEIIFRVWTAQSGGILKWSEQQTVTVDKGYFSVLLGEGTEVNGELRPALSTVFMGTDASERFIAVTVKGIGPGGADADILPRLQLVSAPFAYLAAQVAPNSIGSASIANNTIASADVLDNSITGGDILNESITHLDLAPNSVYSSEIAANAVGSSEVIDNSLTSSDLAANSVYSSELGANSVYASEIATGAVGSSEVLDNSLTANDLAANSVYSSEIGANAVGSSEVINNSLTASDLAENSVGSSELASYITHNGRIGLNAQYGDVAFTLRAEAGENHLVYAQDSNSTLRWYVNIIGQSFALLGHYTGSDISYKQNIESVTNALDNVMQLKPKTYQLISNPELGMQIGFIAQDVQGVFPELIVENPQDEKLGLNYSGFGVVAVAAIQELNEKVETLEEEKNTLLQRLEALESRVQSLEQ